MKSPSLDKYPQVGDWIRLDAPGVVTVRSGKVEIGQRISTALLANSGAAVADDILRERVRDLSRLFKFEFMYRADTSFDEIFHDALGGGITAASGIGPQK